MTTNVPPNGASPATSMKKNVGPSEAQVGIAPLYASRAQSTAGASMYSVGDHLRSPRGLYDHHGIYLGDNQVIHYAGDEAKDVATAKVRIGTLEEFAHGAPVEVVPYGVHVAPADVIARARSLLGEARYNVVLRNCEHLATLAKVGTAFSHQVSRALASVGTPVVAGLAVAVIGTGAAVHTIGAAKTMSALTAAGRVVGGGPLAGVAVSGAAIGATSLVVLLRAYRDDPFATDSERQARKKARTAAMWAIGLGAVAAVGLVAIAGRGSGAALVSSGLKAVGGVVGGGMAAGAVICMGAPLTAAAVAAKYTYVRAKVG